MQCSICNNSLQNASFRGANFKFCKSCNTVYIEINELKKALSSHNTDKIIENLNNINIALVNEKGYSCSICGQKMEKIAFEDVILDRCKQCNIIVFEDGELSKFFSKFTDNTEICSNLEFIKKYFKENTIVETDSNIERKVDNMQNNYNSNNQIAPVKEIIAPHVSGFAVLFFMILLIPFLLMSFLNPVLSAVLMPVAIVFAVFLLKGFKTVKPQEAIVYTLFGNYYGSIKTPGFYWVNPFANPVGMIGFSSISLKVRTLDSGAQKINDELGNPIQVGIIVTWQVVDTAKAIFGVDDYTNFLASQSDAALRSIIRLYPYDAPNDSDTHSLRGDSEEISEKLKVEIQKNVAFAGIKIIRAKISHLAYAPEIAAAMLQRQQANAILDAKKAIVDGSVDMVTMALDKLASSNVQLDEKTKANMVNNLLVALCSNKESQPVTRLDVI